MNSIEINKIAASVLVAGLAFMVAGVVGDALVHPRRLHEPAIKIPEAAAPAGGGAPAAPAIEPISGLLASANAENGAGIARRVCSACHSFDQGGRTLVGPNLYGIVEAPHAHVAGFNYSAAIAGMKDKPWTYEELNRFIAKPADYAPGTRMGYAGLSSTQQRADLIAYLRTLDPNPKPLPDAAAIAAAAPPAAASAPATTAPAAPAAPQGAAPGAAPAAGGDLAVRLAAADAGRGETAFKAVCGVCHTNVEGQPARVGPNLWDVVGREHSSFPGFQYSPALKAKTGPWTFEDLDAWLANPATYAPGNRMGIGVANPTQRADIIVYLRTLSASPKPLP